MVLINYHGIFFFLAVNTTTHYAIYSQDSSLLAMKKFELLWWQVAGFCENNLFEKQWRNPLLVGRGVRSLKNRLEQLQAIILWHQEIVLPFPMDDLDLSYC